MSIPSAYLGIILIWSTTPLAIQWSSQGTGFAFAVLLRMIIGVIVAGGILWLARIPFPLHARARRAYVSGGLGLFGAMALTYWGAQYVHSGLVSVLFGLSPLMAGALSVALLGERALTPAKVLGLILALAGLAVIFLQGRSLPGTHALTGLAALLLAVAVYSASLVNLKRIGDDSPPLATTVGTLLVSLPGFAALWWGMDGTLPAAWSPRALAAIVYLGVFGSVIGFALYYYVIKHLRAASIALINLIAPVLALILGASLNGESLTPHLMAGTGLILAGLALHQWPSGRPRP